MQEDFLVEENQYSQENLFIPYWGTIPGLGKTFFILSSFLLSITRPILYWEKPFKQQQDKNVLNKILFFIINLQPVLVKQNFY